MELYGGIILVHDFLGLLLDLLLSGFVEGLVFAVAVGDDLFLITAS